MSVTANTAKTAAVGSAASHPSRDWDAVRQSAEIQFAPVVPPKPPKTPEWFEGFARFLRKVFGPLAEWLIEAWPVLEVVLIVLAVLLVLYLLWKILAPLLGTWRHRRPTPEAWAPTREEALALLEDADRLAAEGRFGEAAHLLLQRSVGQIRAAQPRAVVPASTAREIALLPQLPQPARSAFAVVAGLVERCLFALRELDAADWKVARAAYADFALAELRG